MRTSLKEIENIEGFLLQKIPTDESLVFQSRMIINPELKYKTSCQQKAYEVIQLAGRVALRNELMAVENSIFKKSAFRKKITKIFESKN